VAAAWAMGQTADPRFSGVVKELMSDADESVRRVANLSASRIEARVTAEREKPACPVRILRARGPDPEWRAITVLLPHEIAASVKPTHFTIEENSQPIFGFEVEHLTARVPLRVGIALPEAKANSTWVVEAEAALKLSLATAGPKDAFAALRYSSAERKTSYAAGAVRTAYTTRSDILSEQIGVQVPVLDVQGAVKELADNLFSPAEAQRALLLFAETAPDGSDASRYCPDQPLSAALRSKHIPLHVIARADGEGEPLKTAATTHEGIFLAADTPQALQQSCATIFNSFTERFEIRYSSELPFEAGATVKVTVYAPNAWGEDTQVLI